jgi:oligoribonuclease
VTDRATQKLVWMDCEMTGLDLTRDALIEVAAIVTDAELIPLDDGVDVIIHVDDDVPDPKMAPLCGNSIATDRGFLARDMPDLDGYLHYRMIDVSSIKELARRWYPKVYFAQPQKGLAHRALADIRESIRELIFYRRTLFVALPGPTSEEAQAAARTILGAPADPVD